MSRNSPRCVGRSRWAFTLIELLVVISVIIILASLLLPVVTSATGKARSVQCVSNLGQIGKGLFNYLKDNKMRFQISWGQMDPDLTQRRDWTAVMLPYSPDPEIFKCPVRKPYSYTEFGNPTRGIIFPLNYGICTAVQGKLYITFAVPSKLGVVADAGHDRFFALDVDESAWGIIQVKNEAVHDKRAGVLFADWHAGLVKKEDVTKEMFVP